MKKHILTIIAIGLIFGTMFASVQAVYADENAAGEPVGCIAFTSASEFTVSLGPGKTWDGTIQYSTDGGNWQDYTAGDVKAAAGSDDGYSIFFRGNGNSYISKGTIRTGDRSSFKLTGSEIACSGNIENLLDHMAVEGHTPPDMSNYAFAYLFRDCASLTEAPELPATTLADYCYYHMFQNCTNLTAAPELPATTMAKSCYDGMFYGCSSLTVPPALPATTLAEACYYYMFYGCTNLTTAPVLPATTLAEACYYYMFYGCTNLTTAPELPATTLDRGCYAFMFSYCTSLSKAPKLPATTLAEGCYSYMFYGCSSLTVAPELPATTLTGYCYHAMFSYCTSLSKAPELPATTLAEGCYSHMFHGCSSLTVPPALPATTLTVSCYEEMFESSGVKISEDQGIYDGVYYGVPYRIPKEGDGTNASVARQYMFLNTSGPFARTPELNRTYYLATPGWSGIGTEDKPYVISDATGWNTLMKFVRAGYSMEGLFFKLGENIEVTEMVGTYEKPFSGSFDGDGHTLTFNADDAPELCAPFVYAKDASFKNLHIAGTIKTKEKFAAGLIGHFDGKVNVTNCRCSITIDSSVNGDGTHGGFIAAGEINGTADFKGCIFDGKLLGPETDRCGGFVGWANPTDKIYTVKDCLFAPQELTLKSSLFTFIRNAPGTTIIQNSYYTKNINDNSQGKAARIVTVDQGITVSSETAKYDVSGITAYKTGLAYEATSNERVYYAGKDDKVTVTIQSVCDGVTANAGALTGAVTSYTLTMPDENVTLTLTKGAYHKWKFTGFTWTGDEENGYTAAVANYECENDSAHKDTVTKVTLDKKLTPPTCTTGGKTAFTAAVTATDSLDGKDHSESKDAIATNATGHDWGEVTYTWSNDNSEVKAEHACTSCKTTEDETVAVTSEVTKPPTCVEKGETTYTPGEFKNKAFKAQAKTLEDVPATDHKWKDATCTEPRTCSVCNAKEGEALGHNWGAWTKLDENQHQRVCGNDPNHKETGDHAWDDGIVTKEPTTEETGEKTFTCSICKAERTEVLPKKEEVDPITPTDDTADDTPVDDDIPVVNTAKIHTVGNFTKKQMKLVFPADKSVTNYRIQYRMAGKKTWKSGWSAGTDIYVIKGLKKTSLCEFRIAGFVKLTDGTWIRGKWSKVSYRYMSAVPLKTIKADKKKITVTWTKDRKASGYQIQCSLKSSMAGAKTITVNGASKTKCTIKGLKSGKRYYVKIRPVKAKSGKKYLGILTKAKAAKVK